MPAGQRTGRQLKAVDGKRRSATLCELRHHHGRILHVSRPTVEKYIKAGELPSALIGRCRRIRRTDLEAFLEHRTAYGWHTYRAEPTPTVDRPMELPDEGDDIAF